MISLAYYKIINMIIQSLITSNILKDGKRTELKKTGREEKRREGE